MTDRDILSPEAMFLKQEERMQKNRLRLYAAMVRQARKTAQAEIQQKESKLPKK